MTKSRSTKSQERNQPLLSELYTHEELAKYVFNALMETDTDSIYIKDPQGRLALINQTVVTELDAQDKSEIIGKTDRELFGEAFGKRTAEEEARIYETGQPQKDLVEVRVDDNFSNYWTYTTKIPLRDDQGKIFGLIGFTRNISKIKSKETRLHALATHDTLTNVYNRYGLEERLKEMLLHSGNLMAVLMLDVDNFKAINDHYYHKTGDEFLKWLAWLLKSTSRGNDVVARVGGDEFVIVLDNLREPEDVSKFCTKLFRNMQQTMDKRYLELGVGISVGVSLFPGDAENTTELLELADISLYHVKKNHKGQVSFFRDINQQCIE
jgi:diguanylate cyclase (GGDEF)-like protein/PAS domain S-box-containing protein